MTNDPFASDTPEAPLNLYTGEPFRMDHHDGELLIYSIGGNGKDERGPFDANLSLSLGPDDVTAGHGTCPRRQPALRRVDEERPGQASVFSTTGAKMMKSVLGAGRRLAR